MFRMQIKVAKFDEGKMDIGEQVVEVTDNIMEERKQEKAKYNKAVKCYTFYL